MTQRDKIGLGVIVILFAILAGLLALTVRPMSDQSYSIEESYIVQQRMRNLEKSK